MELIKGLLFFSLLILVSGTEEQCGYVTTKGKSPFTTLAQVHISYTFVDLDYIMICESAKYWENKEA